MTDAPIQVLIVEDVSATAHLLQAMLAEKDNRFRANIVTCLKEALTTIQDERPDAILLDLNLPDSSGLDTLKQIISAEPEIPVLVITGEEDEQLAIEAMHHGVQSYLIKGQFNAALARRAVRFSIERMSTQKILNEKVAELTHLTKRIRKELKTAQNLQISLLPSTDELQRYANSYNLEIVGHFQPSTELSGDLWTAMPLSDWRVGIFLADLTGHGMSAAINAFRLHGLIKPTPPFANEVSEFMTFLSDRLKAMLPVGQFAAGFYGIVDPVEGSLLCSGAAMQPPILVSGPGAEAELIDVRGVPLGVVDNPTYKVHRRDFNPGAVLLCYSDALVETPDKSGRMITTEELLEWVSETVSAGGDVVETVWKTAIDRLGTVLPDDLTMVSVRRKIDG